MQNHSRDKHGAGSVLKSVPTPYGGAESRDTPV
jgi:hypothetical protein